MKLLLDMNLSPRLVDYLNGRGIEAVHWADVGIAKDTDETIARRADLERLVIVTHDLDFGGLVIAGGKPGPSIIQIRADDLSVADLEEP